MPHRSKISWVGSHMKFYNAGDIISEYEYDSCLTDNEKLLYFEYTNEKSNKKSWLNKLFSTKKQKKS